MVGWPSGLRQQFAKLRRVKSLPRGFESHTHRHFTILSFLEDIALLYGTNQLLIISQKTQFGGE